MNAERGFIKVPLSTIPPMYTYGNPEREAMDQTIRNMHRAEALRAARANLAGCHFPLVNGASTITPMPPYIQKELGALIVTINEKLAALHPRYPLVGELGVEVTVAFLADLLLESLEDRCRSYVERAAREDLKRMTVDEAIRTQHTGAFVPITEPEEKP